MKSDYNSNAFRLNRTSIEPNRNIKFPSGEESIIQLFNSYD